MVFPSNRFHRDYRFEAHGVSIIVVSFQMFSKLRGVFDYFKLLTESIEHFVFPLVAQTGGAYNQYSFQVVVAGFQFKINYACLDSLSQTYFVCDEETMIRAFKEFHCRLKLIRFYIGFAMRGTNIACPTNCS